MITTDTKAWHQQFWPWFLILFPTVMIIICLLLFYFAARQPISMVKKDYYQEGLTINKNLAEIKHARKLGLHANIVMQQDHRIRVALASTLDFPQPPALILQFDHPVNDDKDLSVTLAKKADKQYASDVIGETQWHLLHNEKRWYLHLQSVNNTMPEWILEGETNQAMIDNVTLDANGN